jgi:hypothetical protein
MYRADLFGEIDESFVALVHRFCVWMILDALKTLNLGLLQLSALLVLEVKFKLAVSER